MKKKIFLPVLIFFSACANIETSGDVQSGRGALINGQPQVALAHFQRAAQADPKHIATISPLHQAVWTYVGRAYYAMGKLTEARQALEQALTYYPQDPMAKLYLGLTLLRQQKEQTIVKPFSLDDLIYALSEGISSDRVSALVKQRGVSFEPTSAAESALKKAGANDQLIREIKEIGPPRKAATTSGGAFAEQGVKEVERGMRELHDWLEYITYNTEYGQFWDPGKEVRSNIQTNLRMISTGQVDREKLIAGGEWIGLKLENEVEVARRDEREHLKRMQQGR